MTASNVLKEKLKFCIQKNKISHKLIQIQQQQKQPSSHSNPKQAPSLRRKTPFFLLILTSHVDPGDVVFGVFFTLWRWCSFKDSTILFVYRINNNQSKIVFSLCFWKLFLNFRIFSHEFCRRYIYIYVKSKLLSFVLVNNLCLKNYFLIKCVLESFFLMIMKVFKRDNFLGREKSFFSHQRRIDIVFTSQALIIFQ